MTSAGTTAGSRQAIKKRSVEIAGHRTSLSLEEAFWHALKRLAAADGVSLNKLIERIDRERESNLSSAVRVYVLERLEAEAATASSRTASSGPFPGPS